MKHCKFSFWYFVSQTTSPICLKVFKHLLSFLGFLPSDFCCDFELLLQSSALHLQSFCKFCCMLLIRLPVTWHLLWCWKDSCDTACGVPWECLVHEGVLFWFFLFHWARPPHFLCWSDVDFIKGFPGDSALWEFFQWLPERSWPYQSFCASPSCPTFRLFSLLTDSRNLCRQQESLGIKP